eukprot:jgi/Chrpa1/27686/Chrysochromulina_OHIO_Genome00011873-RA
MMQSADLMQVDLLQLYNSAEASNSLLTDMVTSSILNTISDFVAQATQGSSPGWRPDPVRTARFSVFGFMDGAMSHGWFALLYTVLGNGVGLEGQAKIVDILVKQFAEAFVYTPYWALWFLCGFSLLEGRIVEYCIPGVTAERCRGTFWETGKLYKKAEGVAMTQAEYSQALTELDSLGNELKRLGQLADDGLAGEVGAGAAKTRVALRQAGERVILALVGDDRLDSNRRLLLVIAVLDDVDREALSQPATSRSNAAAGFAPLRLMLDSASRRFEDFRKALPAQPADVEDI